jgi:hypothetical protein
VQKYQKTVIDFLTMDILVWSVGVYSNWQSAGRNLQEWQPKDDMAMQLKRAEIVLLLYLFGNWQPSRSI